MDFSYKTPQFINLQSKMIDRKNDEKKKKEEELKEQESEKNPIPEPQAEKVTAKADELLTNYIKGTIRAGSKAHPNLNPIPGDTPTVIVGEEALVTAIEQWNNLDNSVTNEEKMEILNQIIGIYTELGDEESAQIWRVRRMTTYIDMQNSQLLEIYKNLPNGYNPDSAWTALFDSEDFGYLLSFLPSNQLDFTTLPFDTTDEERLACMELECSMSAWLIVSDTLLDPQIGVTYAHGCSNMLHEGINACIQNPIFEGAEWQSTYAEFSEKLDILSQITLNGMYSYAPLEVSAVKDTVTDLIELLSQLNEQGFPYCDKLRMTIIGYLESRQISAQDFGLI